MVRLAEEQTERLEELTSEGPGKQQMITLKFREKASGENMDSF